MTSPTTQNPEPAPLLTREQLRQRLNARGYPMSVSYFAKLCLPSVGGGPPIAKQWGKRPLYNFDDALAWAESRCTAASSKLVA
jgi:hypothetical protein